MISPGAAYQSDPIWVYPKMPLTLTWTGALLRLALTVVAGLAIGYNRTEEGKAAGMRTTLLVCLAASVAMIQVNLLLSTAGRPPGSFVMNDLMRLPLGILTGVGFIGGGAILRRDNLVVGVTTAATLWLVTVIGLCLGGGQIGLGLGATAIGLLALWGMKAVEDRLHHAYRARLLLELDAAGPDEPELRQRIEATGLKVTGLRTIRNPPGGRREFIFELQQLRRSGESDPPPLVDELSRIPGVIRLEWDGVG